jgi:glycosyltransferase involved in cell wall biosynthesis
LTRSGALLAEDCQILRILYVQFTDPAEYPPLEHSSQIFAEKGWEVLLLGMESGNTSFRLPAHAGIRVKRVKLAKGGWWQKLQYLFFFVWTLYWTWWWKPQWVYASDPLSCPVAWLVQKLTGARVVYHEHDSPVLDQAQSWFMKQVFAYRNRLGRDAEMSILPQRARMVRFLETTRRTGPTFCVWNCPAVGEVTDCNSAADGELIIHYHGSITNSRLPAGLIIAASRFKGAVRVQVTGYEAPGSTGYIRQLITLAARSGVTNLIEVLGTTALRSDLLRVASKAHVGLSLMPKWSADINMQHMVGASNKPFDCMACGLPLLVSDLPDWVSTFVEPGYARACDPDDADSIEAELRWYLDNPAERREMGRRCKEKIRRFWNYEAMFAGVLAEMKMVQAGEEIPLNGRWIRPST